MTISKLNFVWAGVVLAAVPLLAAAPQSQTSAADKLLLQMKADAQTIETHATQLEKLAKDPNAQWAQFDQQWNEIKPAQEALQMKIKRLESMRSSLSDQQRKALDESKQAAEMVSARTRELYRMIEQPGNDLTSARFRVDAQSLLKNADTLARTA